MSEAIKFIDFGDAKLPIAAKPHYIIEAEKNSADLIQILNPKKKTKKIY